MLINFFEKVLHLIKKFLSQNSIKIKEIVWASDIVAVLVRYLNFPKNLQLRHLGIIIQIIHNATKDETKNRFEELGIIKALIKTLDFLVKQIYELLNNQNLHIQAESEKPYTHEKIIFDTLRLLLTYCRLSNEMTEQAVSCGFIHLTHKIIGINDSKLNRLILDLLAEFVIRSESAREGMWNSVNGPLFLTKHRRPAGGGDFKNYVDSKNPTPYFSTQLTQKNKITIKFKHKITL